METLFSPLALGSITLKNRIVVSPMCMYSATDGFINDWHLVHYGSRAVGGAGAVILEASAVRADGRISTGDLGIYQDEHIEGLRRVATFISSTGSIPGIQLAHAGRKGSTWVSGDSSKSLHTEEEGGWTLLAPSAIPFSDRTPVPRAMDTKDITEIRNAFRDAAKRALKAGFKLIEIHAAHGYLIHSFLSPLSNQRTDEYGGSLENRSRFLLNIIDAVREEWPADYAISVRLSATDWHPEGWSINDSVWLSSLLEQHGVHLIDVSSGGIIGGVEIPVGPGYQVPLAHTIKEQVKSRMLVAAVGLITDEQQAEEILSKGDADLILLARELLRNPYFPIHAARRMESSIDPPIQYTRAFN